MGKDMDKKKKPSLWKNKIIMVLMNVTRAKQKSRRRCTYVICQKIVCN